MPRFIYNEDSPTSMHQEVLDFWFKETPKELWFEKNTAFDKKVTEKFAKTYDHAVAGELDEWKDAAKSCLALIIVLDQFPRNMFRDSPKAFAHDALARDATKHALEEGYEELLKGAEKSFLIMPLMHSEYLNDQEMCLQLFSSWGYKTNVQFAKEHRDIIKRFGRFPHRNKVLGRKNTPEEEEFLKTHKGF